MFSPLGHVLVLLGESQHPFDSTSLCTKFYQRSDQSDIIHVYKVKVFLPTYILIENNKYKEVDILEMFEI